MKKRTERLQDKGLCHLKASTHKGIWSSGFAARPHINPDDWKKETSFYRCLLKGTVTQESVKCSIHIFIGHAKLNSCFLSQSKEQHVRMTHKKQKT